MESMKNMVILKNLPSNIIEEAFVVLKPNMAIKKLEDIEKNIEKDNFTENEYVVKEAEMLISRYINEKSKTKENTKTKSNKKIKSYAIISSVIVIIQFILLLIK